MLKCQTSFRRLFVQMIVLGIAVLSQAVGADIALTVVDPLHPVYGAGEIDAPAESQTLRLVAPRGGVGSAQVVAAGAGLGELTAKIGPLKGAAGTIPEDHLRIRYAAKEQGFDLYEKSLKEKVRGEVLEHHFTEVYYDRLHDAPVKDANGILPIWLTVRVPAGAAAGKYTGTLEAGGQSVAVELHVGGYACPKPDEWVTHVGTPASTDALATHYNVELWSEEHWKLIEEQLKLLGGIGSDDLWIYISSERQLERLALVRFRTTEDGLVPDFDLLDRYLKLYAQHAGRPQWIIAQAWNGTPQRRGRSISDTQPGVVDGKRGGNPRPNTPEGKILWKQVMDGVHQRVLAQGWPEESILIGLSMDQAPTRWTVDAFKEMAPYARWAAWSHGRGGLSMESFEPDEPIQYASGQELAYYAHVYTPRPVTWIRWGGLRLGRIEDAIQGGWNAVRNRYASLRNDLHKYHTPAQYRNLPNGTMLTVDRERGGEAGFAFIWFDFWQRRFPSKWTRTGTRLNTGSIVEPGPSGPIATVRYEMLREGLQETEARVTIEKALVEGNLDEALAEDCRALLEQMIAIRFKKGKSSDPKNPYSFSGGHPGSTLGRPEHTWGVADYPEWMTLTGRLFDLAGKVQEADQK